MYVKCGYFRRKYSCSGVFYIMAALAEQSDHTGRQMFISASAPEVC